MRQGWRGIVKRSRFLGMRQRLPSPRRTLTAAASAALLTIAFVGAAAVRPAAAVASASVRHVGLDDPIKKDTAMRLVSSAENSSLNWRAQFRYIEDIGDGRGYTAGIIGFCSGTGDMLDLVRLYTKKAPGNILAKYLRALTAVNGTASHVGLRHRFAVDWRTAASDPIFTKAQEDERDRVYFTPAVALAKRDGLRALGQFAYYDAAVMHGFDGMLSVRAVALRTARSPALGGGETAYLNAFLDARVQEMLKEAAHDDTSRVDTEQRVFLRKGNLDLDRPLTWHVYGDPYVLP